MTETLPSWPPKMADFRASSSVVAKPLTIFCRATGGGVGGSDAGGVGGLLRLFCCENTTKENKVITAIRNNQAHFRQSGKTDLSFKFNKIPASKFAFKRRMTSSGFRTRSQKDEGVCTSLLNQQLLTHYMNCVTVICLPECERPH